jgi:predicted MFS family arabinose efflux permease
VGLIAHRLRPVVGLAIGALSVTAATCMLVVRPNSYQFVALCSLISFAWNFYYPFQFDLFARVDSGGGLGSVTPAITSGGLAIGPAIGGVLFTRTAHGNLPLFAEVCVVASLVIALTAARRPWPTPHLEGRPL